MNFRLVLFIMPYKVFLSFKAVSDHSNESYWAVLSCGAVKYGKAYKMVLTLKSVDDALVWGHSNESYWAAFQFSDLIWT